MEHSSASPLQTAVAPASLPSVEGSGNPPESAARVNEAPPPGSAATFVTLADSTIVQVFGWITQTIVAQVNLPEHDAEIIAFWVVSSWFQDTLSVFPLLVITGPAHEAMVLLCLLKALCRQAGLVAEFKKADLKELNFSFHTVLISAPNLDNRTAALLGTLSNAGFILVEQRTYIRGTGLRAVYIGEDQTIKRIQHSIRINITQRNAEPPSDLQWLEGYILAIPKYLQHHREKSIDQVRPSKFIPQGLPSEMAAVAKALGTCIPDAPSLQQRLVALLKTQDHKDRSQRTGTIDAVVVEAVLALSREERAYAFTSEITGEANRLVELRGERSKLKPETVGRRLCQLGLRTSRLTFAGNGLVFDSATVALIQELAAVYVD